MSKKVIEREAAHGQRMIVVKVCFWTDQIVEGRGKIASKECWDSGVVRLDSNRAHDISTQNPVPFNSLMDLTAKVEKVLISHGIKLHHGNRSYKLYKTT